MNLLCISITKRTAYVHDLNTNMWFDRLNTNKQYNGDGIFENYMIAVYGGSTEFYHHRRIINASTRTYIFYRFV